MSKTASRFRSVHVGLVAPVAVAAISAVHPALAEDRYFVPGAGRTVTGVPLTDASVRAAVDRYLRDNAGAATAWDELAVLDASSPDGRSARVHLGAVVRPVLMSWVLAPWSDGIALQAESVARGS